MSDERSMKKHRDSSNRGGKEADSTSAEQPPLPSPPPYEPDEDLLVRLEEAQGSEEDD